ncbi:LpqB family beta-propeller domain-containing protein [uncultured Cellulomonas sp.]|uniref:LpqB family beta-propeller domain-containing protein n=1 Tax=uncultured Cellulomonas sp. TaxID=189682 RepID=UPI0026078B04|nr:LpqB family beta-propeller domain-containing protein [uncultured Cellulomonas sp.]
MSPRAASRGPLLAALLALVLCGCVSIPTNGPVAVGDGRVDEPGTVFPLAYSPPADAEPVALVQGFLAAAAAGLSDNYAVARQYLTVGARTEWVPDEGVVVYSTAEPLDLRLSADGSQVSVTLPVVATVDADGRYWESPPGARQEAVFDLVQDASGQWRITALDDGVLMSEPIFESVYRPAPLYFLTPERDELVPEIRWFPQRNTATYAVRELLEGPSPWLRDAVRTAFPEGTQLAVESVPVDADGTATVDLTAAVAAADERDRALLKAQLEEVLELPRIRDVEITIAGAPMVDPPAADLTVDPSPGSDLRVLADDRVHVLDGSEPVPVPELGALGAADTRGLAWSADGDPTVVLSGPDTLVGVPEPGGSPRVLLTGPALVEPSVDPADWIWSGPSASAGRVTAVRGDGTAVDVEAPWLDDRVVRSLQVARDGTRIAVVSVGADGVTVDVAGVVRDDSGTPQRLGERMRVGAPLLDATDVVWVDESTLAVLGTSGTMTGPTVHFVPVSGQTRAVPALPVEPAVGLAAGRGERAVYAVTGTGSLWSLRGTSWVVAAEGVRAPAFPG